MNERVSNNPDEFLPQEARTPRGHRVVKRPFGLPTLAVEMGKLFACQFCDVIYSLSLEKWSSDGGQSYHIEEPPCKK